MESHLGLMLEQSWSIYMDTLMVLMMENLDRLFLGDSLGYTYGKHGIYWW